MMKIIFLISSFLFSSVLYSQTGKVGIGTNDPQSELHIKGSLRLDHPSKGNGYLLQVFDNGSMKWSPLIPNAVMGSIGNATGYSGDIPTNTYLNGNITLSPGKWLVKASLLIPTDYNANATNNTSSSLRYDDIVIRVSSYFTDSNTNANATSDYIPGGATKITGSLITPSMYGMVEGYALLENASTQNKTYYLWGKSDRTAVTSDPNILPLFKLSAFWGENRIYAYPISTTN